MLEAAEFFERHDRGPRVELPEDLRAARALAIRVWARIRVELGLLICSPDDAGKLLSDLAVETVLESFFEKPAKDVRRKPIFEPADA